MKVSFLTNIISPYRLPVFQSLSKHLQGNLCVMTNAKKEFDRNWEIIHQDLNVFQVPTWSFKRKVHSSEPVPFTQIITLHIPYGLWTSLRKYNPDTIISLELGARTFLAYLYCKLFRKKLIIWAYQSRISAKQGSRKLFLRKFLIKHADAVVGMGKQARDVLLEWGATESKIFDALNATDTENINQALANPSKALRIREKFSDRKLAVVVGRLIPLKGLEALIATWKKLPPSCKNSWQLIIIGDGVLTPYLETQIEPGITLQGHIEHQEMPYWYMAADLHIFPTLGDVWGLVVNEASQCGTPTLCSPLAGCYDDLIQDQETGLHLSITNDTLALQELQQTLERNDLAEIGKRAQQHIQSFTPEQMALSFLKAIEST